MREEVRHRSWAPWFDADARKDKPRAPMGFATDGNAGQRHYVVGSNRFVTFKGRST